MIAQGISLSAKQAFLLGVHQPTDTYKLALYTKNARLGPELKQYTANGEVNGPGYEAGGYVLAGFRNGMAGKSAYVTFDDIKVERATFVAHGAVVYNSSKDNAVLCVLNFGGDRHVHDGIFELKFPTPTEKSALILLS